MDPVGWFQSLPTITQSWFGAALVINAATTLDFLRPKDLFFDYHKILGLVKNPSNKLVQYHQANPKKELWRIMTSFLYGGGDLNQFHVLILLYTIAVHSSNYEKNPYRTSKSQSRRNCEADYAFCILFCIMLILGSYLGLDYYDDQIYSFVTKNFGKHSRILQLFFTGRLLKPYFTKNLVTAVMYLWSKRNPRQNINLNFIPIQGQYLPFAHLAIDVMLGNRINEVIHGIIIGHIYYYVVEIFPKLTNGRYHLLQTPSIFIYLAGGNVDGIDDIIEDDNNHHRTGGRNLNLHQPENWNRILREDGATSAHLHAKVGNIESLQALALSSNINDRNSLFATDRNDWQPIHEAVRGGHIEICQFLIEEYVAVGASSNDSNDDNNQQDIDDGLDVAAQQQRVLDIILSARISPRGNGPNPLELSVSTHGPNHPVPIYLRGKVDEASTILQQQERREEGVDEDDQNSNGNTNDHAQ